MFVGEIIFKNGLPYFRTIYQEELLFLWKGELLPIDSIFLKMLNTERDLLQFAGLKINNVLYATKRK